MFKGRSRHLSLYKDVKHTFLRGVRFFLMTFSSTTAAIWNFISNRCCCKRQIRDMNIPKHYDLEI